jgi:hypothetical protein
MAVPFDLTARKVTGPAVAVLDGVKTEAWGAAQFAVSDDGTLVYLPGGAGWIGKLVWVDRKGTATALPLPAQAYGVLKLSPRGQQLAIEVGGATDDIWVYDLARGAFTRLTTEGSNSKPVWNPDGKRVTFTSFRVSREHYLGFFCAESGGSVYLNRHPFCGVSIKQFTASRPARLFSPFG